MVFNIFKAKSKLGIDIGTAAIKVVELSQQNGRWVLDNYGMYELRGQDGRPTRQKR